MIVTEKDVLGFPDLYRRNFINSLTGFKSLNLIGTVAPTGLSNLAPFSQVIHVGANPPLIGILFRPNVVPRHTLENILTTGYFTLNHVQKEFVEKAHTGAARWDISEFHATGLEEEQISGFPAPFVKESFVKMGCKFLEKQDIKSNGTHFIIGQIQLVICPDEFLNEDGFVDLEKAGSITVSGLDSYHFTHKIARFSYPKPYQMVTKI